MKPLSLRVLLLVALSASGARGQSSAASPPDRWAGFRGAGSGHTRAEDLPTTWSAEQNIAWQVTPTGMGQSSPCVWGDRVFVTSVYGANKEHCVVSCYRLQDGLLLWSRTARAGCQIKSTKMVSRGAPTPAVDGDRVYAFFESGDVLALSHDGQLEWRTSLVKRYGKFQGNHGIGSSVVWTASGIVLLVDHAGPSYLLCLDRETGVVRWKVDRKQRVSWSTPVVRAADHGEEVVVSSNGEVAGFRVANGERVWGLDGLVGNTVPSPVIAGGLVVVGASKAAGNLAVRPAGAKASVAWRSKARPLGFASPTVVGDLVLFLNKAGALTAAKLSSGEIVWKQRTAEGCWASPIVAGSRVYLFGKAGTTTILEPSSDGAGILKTNVLETDDTVYGAAAVSAHLVIREGQRLYCLRAVVQGTEKAVTTPAAGSGKGRPAAERR